MECTACGRPRPDDGFDCPACGAPAVAEAEGPAADLDQDTRALRVPPPAPAGGLGIATEPVDRWAGSEATAVLPPLRDDPHPTVVAPSSTPSGPTVDGPFPPPPGGDGLDEGASASAGAALGLYVTAVAVLGLLAFTAAQAPANLAHAAPWHDGTGTTGLLLAPIGFVIVVALIARMTISRAVAPADRLGLALGAAIGPAALVAGWVLSALPGSDVFDTYGRPLGLSMVGGFGNGDLLVATALSVGIGAALGLVQLGPRRSAVRVISSGALSGLLATVPVAVYDRFTSRMPDGITDGWGVAWALAFYVWPAVCSGAVALSTYRNTDRSRRAPTPGTGPVPVAWMPVAPVPGSDPTAGPGAGAGPWAMPVYAQGPTNGLAIASFVLSLVAICGIGSLLAVVFGMVALRQIKASNGWQRGRGLAIAGLVIGIVGLVIVALYVALAVAAGTSTSGY